MTLSSACPPSYRTKQYSAFLILLGLSACGGSGRQLSVASSITASGVSELVERYLKADAAGNGLRAQADSLFTACEGDRSTDGAVATKSAKIVDIQIATDSAVATVEYEELGSLMLIVNEREKHNAWNFEPKVFFERETLTVRRDEVGTLRIDCGPHHGNHWGLAVVAGLTQAMDTISARRWAALTPSRQP